jgi:hypothetical protein
LRKNTRLPEGAGVLPTCLLTDSLANKKAIYDTIGFTPSFDGSSILGQMGCGDTLCSVPFLAEMLRVSSRFMLPLVVGRDGFGGTLALCSCDREPCVAIGGSVAKLGHWLAVDIGIRGVLADFMEVQESRVLRQAKQGTKA